MISDSFFDNIPKRQTFFRCSEGVPCFAAMYITDASVEAGDIVYTTRKWQTGDVEEASRIIFNSGTTYISGEVGTCSQMYPLQARIDGTWEIGKKLGLMNGSWDLHVDAGAKLFVGLALDETEAYMEDATHRSVWVNVASKSHSIIRGKITSGNPFEDETHADPHTLEEIEGVNEVWGGESSVQIYNPDKIKLWYETGANACTAVCHWNVTQSRYEVTTARSDKVVHGIKFLEETCEFKQLNGAEGWTVWNEGTTIQYIKTITVASEGCSIAATFEDCSGSHELITLDLTQFVTNVYMSRDCLLFWRCGSSTGIATGLCFTECDPPTECADIFIEYTCEADGLGGYVWSVTGGTPNCGGSGCVPGPLPTEDLTIADLGRVISINCIPEP